MNFPFPTQPSQLILKNSLSLLLRIQALKGEITEKNKNEIFENTEITELGKILNAIPLQPVLAKILLQTRKKNILAYGILFVCVLSVEQIIKEIDLTSFHIENEELELDIGEKDFLKEEIEKRRKIEEMKKIQKKERIQKLQEYKKLYKEFSCDKSDFFCFVNILGKFLENIFEKKNSLEQICEQFSEQYHLVNKSLKEIYLNFEQILEIICNLIENDNEKQVL